MDVLNIDIETYSDVDLRACGVYKYVESKVFEILLFAFSLNGEPVTCVDLYNLEELPPHILATLTDPNVLKKAANANFEFTCIERQFGIMLDPYQWECTLVKGSMLGLPGNLAGMAAALGTADQKDTSGKDLIKLFCIPCKPTKKNGNRTRNYPHHFPEKWAQFKSYCIQDVNTEMSIGARISFFEIPQFEKDLWALDQIINKRGVYCDLEFAKAAIDLDTLHKEKLYAEAVELTGLQNPNSRNQLIKWLEDALETEIPTLRKADIPPLINGIDDETAIRVLRIRQQLSKTSVSKYYKMLDTVCSDSRIRGLFQFYGANRTARWASRLVQLQNMPRNDDKMFGAKMCHLEFARDLVLNRDTESIKMFWPNVPDVLSQLIRTSFTAPQGLISADFSAIEARVLAWLAGEEWRLKVFETHGKIYEASAAFMFNVPAETIDKGGENYYLRQSGKVAELAFGYQGGWKAAVTMGAVEKGVCDKAIALAIENAEIKGIEYTLEEIREYAIEFELSRIVKLWRGANKKIVQFWYDCQNAAIEAVQDPGVRIQLQYGLMFYVEFNILWIVLPSGRRLAYWKPRIVEGKYGPALQYLNQTNYGFRYTDTYGGKIVENIVQAVSRDCLAVAMIKLKDEPIVMHVHDEIVIEHEGRLEALAQLEAVMSEPIEWAPGLNLTVSADWMKYYHKTD